METGLTKNDAGVTPSPLMQLKAAISSKLVGDASLEEVFNALRVATLRAYLDTGFKQPTGTAYIGTDQPVNLYEAMVNELAVYVRSRLCTLRIDEIGLAISNGCLGDAGEFMGLNKKTFVQFLTVHHNNQQRKLQIANQAVSEEPKRPAPSYEYQFNLAKDNVAVAWNAFLKSLDIEREAGPAYDFLILLGLLSYSDEQNEKMRNCAKNLVASDVKAKRYSTNSFVRRTLNLRLGELAAGEVKEGSENETDILLKFKRLTVKRYFNDIVLSTSDLETLIEGKRQVFYKLLADKEAKSE